MTNRPPREGARWGGDPAPEPTPEPTPTGPPKEYVELCNLYGEENVGRALATVARIKSNYPHLTWLKKSELALAGEYLAMCQRSITIAAADGRAHTMPQSLEVAEKVIGEHLVKNPEVTTLEGVNLTYGDEASGRKEKRKQFYRKAVFIGVGIFVGMVLYSFEISSISIAGYGVIIGVGVTNSLMGIYDWLVTKGYI